jgi:hypothetical protein
MKKLGINVTFPTNWIKTEKITVVDKYQAQKIIYLPSPAFTPKTYLVEVRKTILIAKLELIKFAVSGFKPSEFPTA